MNVPVGRDPEPEEAAEEPPPTSEGAPAVSETPSVPLETDLGPEDADDDDAIEGEVLRELAREVARDPGFIRVFSEFSGPLPPPALLAEYDRVVPGLAGRIAGWTEEESEHRRRAEMEVLAMQREIVQGGLRHRSRGQIFGLIVVLVIAVGSLVLIGLGHSIVGLAALVLALATLASAFWISRRADQSDDGLEDDESEAF